MDCNLVPINRFGEYATEWQRLADSQPSTPFFHLDFIEPLLSHFSDGGEQLAIAESGGRTRAMAILARPALGRRNTFQPSQLPLGPVLMEAGLSIEGLADDLIRRLPLTTLVLGLTQIDESICARPADAPSLLPSDYIQTAWIDIAGAFEDYWELRGKNLKQNVRKQRRKLREDGIEVRLEVLRDPKSIVRAIDDYSRLESAGWKASSGTAIGVDNPQGRFYREVLERFCARGKGRVLVYKFSDKPVAMDLCIEDEKSLVVLKTTYDESIKMFSPAVLLHEEAFAQIWAEGNLRRIEFFGRLMDWHTRWTDNVRHIYHLTRYRWPWVRQLRASVGRPQLVASQPVA